MKNQAMNVLKNPSLTLYAFHLISDVRQEQREDAGQLWQALRQLANPFNLNGLQTFSDSLIDEQGYNTVFLPLLPDRVKIDSNNELSCKIYPVRLHDTYAVDFTVFFEDKILDLAQLNLLNPQGCLLPSAINASIGQTLLFYAEPLEGMIPNQALADQCLQALWGNPELPKFVVYKGQLFGSPLFEYEEINDRETAHTTHFLIWFGVNPQTLELAPKINDFLIKLLCQRHKILLVSQLARKNYKDARSLYRQLESKGQEFSQLPEESVRQRAKKLEKLLKEIQTDTAKYTQYLCDLNDHKTTLLANADNYQKTLANILDLALPEDKVGFWQEFHTASSQKRQQTEIDLAYLTPGQASFQQLTESIQSLTQIETIKHEFSQQERLELMVVFVATTLESAAISVKVSHDPHFAEIWLGHGYEMIVPYLGTHLTEILGHISVGSLFGIVSLLILLLMQKVIKYLSIINQGKPPPSPPCQGGE